jgi:hypothetical protein
MSKVATKNHSALWATAKSKACQQAGLCKHSARKMQWATRYYKQHGGTYARPKSARNSLAVWSKQKWRTSTGQKSNGKLRYLPSKAWQRLTPSEKKRTNAAKLKGYREGRQYVRQPRDIARKTKRFRGTGARTKARKAICTKKRTQRTPTRRAHRGRRRA